MDNAISGKKATNCSRLYYLMVRTLYGKNILLKLQKENITVEILHNHEDYITKTMLTLTEWLAGARNCN